MDAESVYRRRNKDVYRPKHVESVLYILKMGSMWERERESRRKKPET